MHDAHVRMYIYIYIYIYCTYIQIYAQHIIVTNILQLTHQSCIYDADNKDDNDDNDEDDTDDNDDNHITFHCITLHCIT